MVCSNDQHDSHFRPISPVFDRTRTDRSRHLHRRDVMSAVSGQWSVESTLSSPAIAVLHRAETAMVMNTGKRPCDGREEKQSHWEPGHINPCGRISEFNRRAASNSRVVSKRLDGRFATSIQSESADFANTLTFIMMCRQPQGDGSSAAVDLRPGVNTRAIPVRPML